MRDMIDMRAMRFMKHMRCLTSFGRYASIACMLGATMISALIVHTVQAKPTLDKIAPHVIQRGAESTIVVEGHRLFDIQQYLAYAPGIEMVRTEPLDKVMGQHYFKYHKVKPGRAIALTLKVAEDCALGRHLFRLRTNEALSEMMAIWISPYPCVKEAWPGHDTGHKSQPGKGNNNFEKAQPISLNTTVTGFHPAYSVRDYDYYSVELKRGQRLTVEQQAYGFAYGGNNDGVLSIYGPDRTLMARVDDTWLTGDDPMVSIIAEKEGVHYIKAHQSVERELGARQYALHFSSSARPLVTYPLGGPAGQTLPIRLIGDVAGESEVKVRLPNKAGEFDESIFPYRVPGVVIPNPLRVSSFGNVLEDGASHFEPETAQPYEGELPIAFNGVITDEGKTDWFRFRARQGERYRIRCYAATLGSAMDPMITIQGAPGNKSKKKIRTIVKQDSRWEDRTWSPFGKWSSYDDMDPVVIFEPNVDGEYVIGIADEQRLYGPDHVYRVEIAPVKNQAQLTIVHDYRERTSKRDSLVVPRGNQIERIWRVVRIPGNHYRGDYDVVAKGLPPGVTMWAPTVTAKTRVLQVKVSAAKDAKPWAGFVDLRLVPREKGADFGGGFILLSPAKWARGGFIDSFMPTRKCAVAVVDPAQFKVHLKQPKLALAQNAVLDLEVTVERLGDFKGDVRISAPWKPDHVTSGILIIPSGKTKGTFQLKATDRSIPGDYPFVLSAHQDLQTPKKGDTFLGSGTGYDFVSTNEVKVRIVRPYIEVKLARAAIERQKEGEIVATLKHIRPLPSAATARLIRLPAGVTLESDVTIKPGDTKVRFPISVGKNCLTGLYKQITCEITIEENGQTITQLSGSGMLRVDTERK